MIRPAFQATVLVTAAATLFAAEAERKRGPQVAPGGVVNAAGFAAGPAGSVAPGSIIAIFGVDLAGSARAVGPGDVVGSKLPRILGGVEVQVNDRSAPLYYVSPGQVNCQIPVDLRPRTSPYTLRVVYNNESSAAYLLQIGPAAPGLFPVVAHQDFSLVGRGEGETPAAPGELIVLFGSGFGPTTFPLDSGQFATMAASVVLPVRVLVNEIALPRESILYAGTAPGFAGLYQVNLLLPAGLSGPDAVAVVEVGGIPAPNGVVIAIKDSSLAK